MSTSMLLGLFDWIGDFFKALFDLIPKIVYLLYASLACIIDVLQLFFRKLAGLDVYYVDGKAVTGDLVGNFIRGIFGMYDRSNITYSALATVFYSMLVFGIIICFASILIAIIKSHYTYDEKSAKGPMQYVYAGVKSVINMVAVPIIVVMGLYVSNALLNALDTITSVSSGTVVAMYGKDAVDQCLVPVNNAKGDKCYIYYDMFGFGSGIFYGAGANGSAGGWSGNEKQLGLIASQNQTFSGSLFRVGAYNANRARIGQMTISNNQCTGNAQSAYKLFKNAKDNDQLADMIDTAFACDLHSKVWFSLDGAYINSSPRYFTNFLAIGTNAFSKFNIGLVWYYYDLWQFNFIVGFAGVIVCVSIFINIIMGLMVRFFMCITLFLVAPPIFGLAPLDGGSAGKKWRENFMKQALMTYGAVVGMNLMMMILPYLYEIDFFNIPIIDLLAQSLFIIVGLVTIKAVIALMSELIGAADANKTGGDVAKEVGSVAGKAANMTLGAAKVGVKGLGAVAKVTGLQAGATALGGKIANSKWGKKVSGGVGHLKDKITGMDKVKAAQQGLEAEQASLAGAKEGLEQLDTAKQQKDALNSLNGMNSSKFNANGFRKMAEKKYGLSGAALDNVVDAATKTAAAGGKMNAASASVELGKLDASYKKIEASGAIADNAAYTQRRNTQAGLIKSHEASYAASQQAYDDAVSSRNKLKRVRLAKNTGSAIGGFFKTATSEIGGLGKKGLASGDFVKSTSDSFTEIDKKKAKEQAKNIASSAQASSRIAAEMEYNRRSAGMSEAEKKKLAKELGLEK